jgi:hypothetical protein
MESYLKIVEKSEFAFKKLRPVLKSFPKYERHELASEINITFMRMISDLLHGEQVKSKRKTYFQEASAKLFLIKVMLKTAKNERYISIGFYEDFDMLLTEIRKMLSSLLKSC